MGVYLGPVSTVLLFVFCVYIKIGFVRKQKHPRRILDVPHSFPETVNILRRACRDRLPKVDAVAAVRTDEIFLMCGAFWNH